MNLKYQAYAQDIYTIFMSGFVYFINCFTNCALWYEISEKELRICIYLFSLKLIKSFS